MIIFTINEIDLIYAQYVEHFFDFSNQKAVCRGFHSIRYSTTKFIMNDITVN